MSDHSPVIIAQRDTADWDACRKLGIGASEAAAACGLSKYQTPLELYLRKRNEIPPIDDNDNMELGRVLEPLVLSRYEREKGVKLARRAMPLYGSPVHPWMIATPDAEEDPLNGVEAKTTSFFRAHEFGEPGTDEVPEDMVMQCQHQMGVMGWVTVSLPVLFDARKLAIYRVRRNDKLIANMIEAEADLWKRITESNPPAADWSHESTPDLIKAIYKEVDPGQSIEIGEDEPAVEWWITQRDMGRQITEMEKERKALRARFMERMGSAAYASLPGQDKVVRRSKVDRAGYVVEPTTYVDLREVKNPKGGK